MALLVASCSTKKNTGLTRSWHSFTARYNTYYNGTVAYIDASLEKEKGNKDNFTERLPLYTVSNKASREIGKGNYETAILKCQKAIQVHSIKNKPAWNKNRPKTEKDIAWLSRKEYNPFLWRAWLLMGRSQFYKGAFDEAAATFAYMSRLYKGQPAIYGRARAWLAKCYIESGWLYDAEDVIRNMQRDSIHWRAQKEWDYTLCDYYLHTDSLPQATKYLRKVIKHEMRSKQRAREYYLLGQIEAAQGHKEEALKAFKKVIRQNPPYELDFNARISMTEVMAQGQAKKMISRLKRMARNDNNKEYLDQVYYAMGNIYLAEKDTTNAISAYEKGNEKATRSGIEKGVLLLHLGDLYWTMEKYSDAKRCYGEAIGLLDKERDDYKQLSERSKVLDELVPYTDAIHLQDSLQALAKMDEKERNAAIDRVIDALKKKEKEEQAKQAEQEAEQREQKYGNKSRLAEQQKPQMPVNNANRGGQTVWYFYNTQAIVQGKQTFQRTWGKRENADDWRRNNKTVVGGMSGEFDEDELENLTDEQKDSIAAVEEQRQQEEEKMDSAVNDPHKREYYLAQIPFEEDQIAASNEIIKDGLYHSAVIFKDKLDNLALSEKAFKRLLNDFPDYDPKDEIYYHLFLLYSRKDEHDVAKTFVDSLKAGYPESKWTTLLSDPLFEENARFGTHIEDSLYADTYDAFKTDDFQRVYKNAEVSEKRFPLGANRDRFIFMNGMTRLNDNDADSCLKCMEIVVKDYPQSPVAGMAGMIINGVKEGRLLYGGKFDLSDVWNRRNVVMLDGDSLTQKEFSKERNTSFLFFFAYPPDSLNENQLLFQMAKYNFTNFLVRNFDLTIEDSYGMHHMTVSGFRNFDEARQYGKMLMQQQSVRKAAEKARPVIISEENLQLIGTRFSYNDYDSFYVANFAPLMVNNPEMLYEPVSVKPIEEPANAEEEEDPIKPELPTEEAAPNGAKPVDPKAAEEELKSTEELIAVPAETEIAVPTETEVVVPVATEVAIPVETEVAVPVETEIDIPAETPVATPEDTFVIEEQNNEVKAEEETFVIEDQKEEVKADEETFVIEDAKQEDSKDEETFVIEEEKMSTDELEDEYYELDGF